MGRLRGLTLTVVAIALSAMAAGCNGAQGNDQEDSGRILKYGLEMTTNGGPQFDPVNGSKSVLPGSPGYLQLIYGRLLNVGQQGQLEPGLITKWEAVDDLTARLTVRDGVTFQDGTKFNAEALKFNWDRNMATEDLAKPVDFQNLESMTVVSENVLEMKYTKPVLSILFNQTLTGNTLSGWPSIASPTAVEKEGDDYNFNPVGAGPYELTAYEAGSLISLRRWEGYWNPDAQKVAGVDFVQVAGGPATISALISGRIDAGRIDGSDLPTMEDNNLDAISAIGTEELFLQPNLTRAPLDNLQVRQAIQYALDRDAINGSAYAGKGVATQLLFPPDSPFYAESVAESSPYSYDPEKAKELLATSGVSLDRPLTILCQVIPSMQRAAEVVQAQLTAVGFNVKINCNANFAPILTSEDQPDFFLVSTQGIQIPDIYLLKDAVFNMGYDNPAFEQDYQKVVGATDQAKQAEAYVKVQQTILDQLAVFSIAQEPLFVGTATNVGGLVLENRGDYAGPDLQGAYFSSN